MEPEIRALLKQNLESTEKALTVLKKIHRAMLWQRFFITVKWLIVLALLVVGFVQFQPYIDTLLETYGTLFQAIEQINTALPKAP